MRSRSLFNITVIVSLLLSVPAISKREDNGFTLFLPAIISGQQRSGPGNPDGTCAIPAEAQEEDVSIPDRSGSLTIKDSPRSANPSDRFETPRYPEIFVLAAGTPVVINSIIKE